MILMHPDIIGSRGLEAEERVTVRSEVGSMTNILVRSFPHIRAGQRADVLSRSPAAPHSLFSSPKRLRHPPHVRLARRFLRPAARLTQLRHRIEADKCLSSPSARVPTMTSVTAGRSAGLAWWSATTIFVSAFLLFQVQPVISKTILPWFGGSPAVWTTALLFFQTMLLAGYAYAHVLIRYVPLARQPLVHVTLLLLALLTLPITPGDFWKPADGSYPGCGRILLLLLAKVGPTYFLLASTGPLIQAWFSEAYPGRSPYRLYALSNFGSLRHCSVIRSLIETVAQCPDARNALVARFRRLRHPDRHHVARRLAAGGRAARSWRPRSAACPIRSAPPLNQPRKDESSRRRRRLLRGLDSARRPGDDGPVCFHEPRLPGHFGRPDHVGRPAQPLPDLADHLLRQPAVVQPAVLGSAGDWGNCLFVFDLASGEFR